MRTLASLLLAACWLAGCTATPVAPPLPELRVHIDGPLSIAQVQETFDAYRKDFRLLLDGPSAPGTRRAGVMTLTFQVSAAGWVRNLEIVQSDVTDTRFRDEVLVQIGLMRFPERSGPTRVKNYPLSFKNQNR